LRLPSELWVRAYLGASAARGAPAMLVQRGDPDAGSIFVKVARMDGTALLFGPPLAGAEGPGDHASAGRWFAACPSPGPHPERDVDAYLASQRRFDSDLWIVEVESPAGIHGLEEWLVQGT
jgi:hypothetical protein